MRMLPLEAWLHQTLSADAALAQALGVTLAELADRVHADEIPEGPDADVLPAVVYLHQAGSSAAALGGAIAEESLLYAVKAVGAGTDFTALRAAADRIDGLLQGAVVDLAAAEEGLEGEASQDGARAYGAREATVKYLEREGGIRYSHLGGLYRFDIEG